MSESCEIVEVLATATSSCPTTDVVMVQSTVGSGQSMVMQGVTPSVPVGAAEAVSQVTIDAYALMIDTALLTDSVSPTVVVTGLLRDAARGRSSLLATLSEMATSVAAAEDEIAAMDVPQLLLSAAQATSSLTGGTVAVFHAEEGAEATSYASLGLLESVTEGASTSSMVVLLRRVEESVVSTAEGVDEVTASAQPQHFLLLSSGHAACMVALQTEHNAVLYAAAEATTSLWSKDNARVAYVLNTETTAGCWYTNYDFESIIQTPTKVLAVGPDGLYELVGTTDAGTLIDAEVMSGFVDFGIAETKRVDNMYFGYTSEGRIAVTAEAYDSAGSAHTYFLEQRAAGTPRNSRLTPGKGLWGRYWRLTIRNVDGADFEVHDATVDIAVSSRRV